MIFVVPLFLGLLWCARFLYWTHASKKQAWHNRNEPFLPRALFLCSSKYDLAILAMIPILNHREWTGCTVNKESRFVTDYHLDLEKKDALCVFHDDSFDTVVLFSCPCHTWSLMHNASSLPSEIARILRNEGCFYIKSYSFHSDSWFQQIEHWSLKALERLGFDVKKERVTTKMANILWPFRGFKEARFHSWFSVFQKQEITENWR